MGKSFVVTVRTTAVQLWTKLQFRTENEYEKEVPSVFSNVANRRKEEMDLLFGNNM